MTIDDVDNVDNLDSAWWAGTMTIDNVDNVDNLDSRTLENYLEQWKMSRSMLLSVSA